MFLMLIQEGPRAGDTLYLVTSGEIFSWFELDGTPLAAAIEDVAFAYTCADPAPPVPSWYVEP